MDKFSLVDCNAKYIIARLGKKNPKTKKSPNKIYAKNGNFVANRNKLFKPKHKICNLVQIQRSLSIILFLTIGIAEVSFLNIFPPLPSITAKGFFEPEKVS